jgi:histidyl-tRNA synthetase
MEERYKRPRGTQDVLPEESERLEALRRHTRSVVSRYGYGEIQTPVFEQTAVFVDGVGDGTDIVQHERYTFTDAGGVSLTLRPEGTAAVARAFVEHSMVNWPQPVRLYYWQPMFRRERPQAGRFRQHTQYGIELIGSQHFSADAEVIAVGVRILAELGKAPHVLVNSMGDEECRPLYRAALVEYYTAHRAELCEDCQERLFINPLRLLDCKKDVALKEGAPDIGAYWCDACRAHFDGLTGLLDAMGIVWSRDNGLVRGLDYYHRTVFEVHDPNLGAQSTLIGGGRYDGLASRVGGAGATPGVGFGAGAERLLLTLPPDFGVEDTPRVFVAQVGEGSEGFLAAERLRRAGIATDVDVLGRSLKAQMKDAARRARFAVIAGGREWAEGRAPVRDLESGETHDVALDALVDDLRARIAAARQGAVLS